MTKIAVPAAVALVLIMVGTVIQGQIMDRSFPIFGKPKLNNQLEQFAERLPNVPYEFGDWVGEDLERTAEDELQLTYARVVGSISRVYTNRFTGEQLQVFIVCGKSQNVADHTPDQCFRAAGFAMLRDPIRYMHTIENEQADSMAVEFAVSEFKKQNQDSPDEQARVFWSWRSPSESWQAPRWPLFHYAGTPALYKMYILRPLAALVGEISDDPVLEFCDVAMPDIERALMSDSTTKSDRSEAATPAAEPSTDAEEPSEPADETDTATTDSGSAS